MVYRLGLPKIHISFKPAAWRLINRLTCLKPIDQSFKVAWRLILSFKPAHEDWYIVYKPAWRLIYRTLRFKYTNDFYKRICFKSVKILL